MINALGRACTLDEEVYVRLGKFMMRMLYLFVQQEESYALV